MLTPAEEPIDFFDVMILFFFFFKLFGEKLLTQLAMEGKRRPLLFFFSGK